MKFGICDIDKEKCYSNGCICRLNKIAGFQTNYDYSNPQVKQPFRNKKCSHYKKDINSLSENELGLIAVKKL